MNSWRSSSPRAPAPLTLWGLYKQKNDSVNLRSPLKGPGESFYIHIIIYRWSWPFRTQGRKDARIQGSRASLKVREAFKLVLVIRNLEC